LVSEALIGHSVFVFVQVPDVAFNVWVRLGKVLVALFYNGLDVSFPEPLFELLKYIVGLFLKFPA
jgi:hypothetical protein